MRWESERWFLWRVESDDDAISFGEGSRKFSSVSRPVDTILHRARASPRRVQIVRILYLHPYDAKSIPPRAAGGAIELAAVSRRRRFASAAALRRRRSRRVVAYALQPQKEWDCPTWRLDPSCPPRRQRPARARARSAERARTARPRRRALVSFLHTAAAATAALARLKAPTSAPSCSCSLVP